jgi:hypothetical protein
VNVNWIKAPPYVAETPYESGLLLISAFETVAGLPGAVGDASLNAPAWLPLVIGVIATLLEPALL